MRHRGRRSTPSAGGRQPAPHICFWIPNHRLVSASRSWSERWQVGTRLVAVSRMPGTDAHRAATPPSRQCCLQRAQPLWSSLMAYRADSKISRNPNFCVGCFELIISKKFAAASKMSKNGQKLFFLRFFLRNPFLRRVLDQKLIFLRFFFAFWGLGLIHFVATARNHAYLGLWDCSPFLHRHTNIHQLDSGIAVHSTDKHQQAWFRSPSFSTNQFQACPS